jgi:hypothetical protein
MPYTQKWGISRNVFQSPLNDNGSQSIMTEPADNDNSSIPGFAVDVSPDVEVDSDIISQNNRNSIIQITSNLGDDFDDLSSEDQQLRKNRLNEDQSSQFWNLSDYDKGTYTEDEIGNMYKNNPVFAEKYHDYADKKKGDTLSSMTNTFFNNPAYVAEHLKSYLPFGLDMGAKQWSKNIKGDSKNFMTGLRKTVSEFESGGEDSSRAMNTLMSTPGGMDAFTKDIATDFYPPLVAMQSAAGFGTHMGEGAGDVSTVRGQLVPNKFLSDDKNTWSSTGAAIKSASTYAPFIKNVKKGKTLANVYNIGNQIWKKQYKGNKILNVGTQTAGLGKSGLGDKLSGVYNYAQSSLPKTKPNTGTGGFTATSVAAAPFGISSKIASYFGNKIADYNNKQEVKNNIEKVKTSKAKEKIQNLKVNENSSPSTSNSSKPVNEVVKSSTNVSTPKISNLKSNLPKISDGKKVSLSSFLQKTN